MDQFEFNVETAGVIHRVRLDGVSEKSYQRIIETLSAQVKKRVTGREAIAAAFELAVQLCPDANHSDIWCHVIYRHYVQLVSHQSWVRTSGEAFELFLSRYYNSLLTEKGVHLVPLFDGSARRAALQRIGIPAGMGTSKLDIAVEASGGLQDWKIIGGIHAKVSLAERISDDVPVSQAMMQRGYWSPLCTLDVKTYPPRDLTNRGELGTPDRPSDKRGYFEEQGLFSACYSYNLRTVPSRGKVPSGRRIYTLTFRREVDQLCSDALAERQKHLR
jgi:hypothetical protein